MNTHQQQLVNRLIKLLQSPPKRDDHLKGWGNECLQVMCQIYGSILHESYTLPYNDDRRIPVNQTRTQETPTRRVPWMDKLNKSSSKKGSNKKGANQDAKDKKRPTQKAARAGRGKSKL